MGGFSLDPNLNKPTVKRLRENLGYLTCDSKVIMRWFQEIIIDFVELGFGIGLNKDLSLFLKNGVLV